MSTSYDVRQRVTTRTAEFWLSLCAAAIIFTGMALSFAWVTLVPIFEAPDEQTHFDYVYDIYAAGRLIPAREGIADYSPTVRAMIGAVDLNRIAFRMAERVAADYGTPAGLERIRQSSPSLDRQSFQGPHHVVPILIGTYPPGYYALAAIGAALQVGPHANPVDVFFAVRRFGVVLFGIGLAAAWGIFRSLKFPPVAAIVALATIALFPLSSFVSSYVQPDNLSFTLTLVDIWLALLIRNHVSRLVWFIAYGLGLGLLLLTKDQYFVAVAIATLPIVLRVSLRRGRMYGAAVIGLIVMFVASAYGVARWIVTGSSGVSYFKQRALYAPLADAFHRSGADGYTYIWRTTVDAATNFYSYSKGLTSLSYWGLFGWIDTTIAYVPQIAGVVFPWIIQIGTIVVALAVALVVLRRLAALVRIARTKHRVHVFDIAFGDPLLLSYIAFTVILFSLYVASNNVFAAQGRNWYPLVPAAFACVLFYAPRVFTRRFVRRTLSIVGLLFFVTYDASAAYGSLIGIEDRYYQPRPATSVPIIQALPEVPGRNVATIDLFSDGPHVFTPRRQNIVRQGDVLYIRGWAIDGVAHASDAGEVVTIDDRPAALLTPKMSRPDVAAAYHTAAYGDSGFEGMIPTATLALGEHRVAVILVSADRLSYTDMHDTYLIRVTKKI